MSHTGTAGLPEPSASLKAHEKGKGAMGDHTTDHVRRRMPIAARGFDADNHGEVRRASPSSIDTTVAPARMRMIGLVNWAMSSRTPR
jgi:hypothetical protein